jgi:hypothetical protein
MRRPVLPLVALTLVLPVCRAAEAVVRLDVRPMPAPQPALRYQLLPDVRELRPGNPAQWYIRCFQEQRIFFFGKEPTAERARLRSLPLDKLRAQKLRSYGGSALTQADWAARLDSIDWQVLDRVQSEGLELVLSELEPLRVLATALQLRFRIEVAAGNFDDAIRTAKTMFALARHLGEYPAESANRVGLSAAELALDTLEEMVQQKDCPNLYWALTDLPCPLVDVRKGLQGTCAQADTELRLLRDDAPMSESELEGLVSRLSGMMGFTREQTGQAPHNLRATLRAQTADLQRVQAIRDRLFQARLTALIRQARRQDTVRAILDGLAAESNARDLVRKLPPLQVILLDEKRVYEVQRDEHLKLLGLAPWQIDAVTGDEPGRGKEGLFRDLLPHVSQIRRAQARLEQRIALLRHVEALRLHAAAHDNKLPQTLADVAVPLPLDPFTGKSFHYKVEGTVAHLRGSPPRGEERNPHFNIHYTVALQK